MKTLSANFQAALSKDPSQAIRYIVKIEGATNTYYVGNYEGTITDSGTKRVMGLLLNSPVTKEMINIYTGKSSVGGFSIQIADTDQGGGNYFSDDLAGEYFYNRDVTIYLNYGNLSTLSDCLIIYKGLFEKWEVDKKTITISIVNSTRKIDKLIPSDVITFSDLNYDGPNESIGKAKPVIYGDHPFSFGGGATSSSTNKTNNMPKAVYLGTNSSGNYEYLISSHALKTTESGYDYNAWLWDSKLRRYVKVAPADVSYSTVGTDVIVTVDSDATLYHYEMPTGKYTTDTNGAAYVNDPELSCDNNYSTECSLEFSGGTVLGDYAEVYIYFEPVGYAEYYDNITAIKISSKHDADPSFDTDDMRLSIRNSVLDDEHNLTPFTGFLTNSETIGSIADMSAYFDGSHVFKFEALDTIPVDVIAECYMTFRTVEYTITAPFDLFVACEGHKDDVGGTITGTGNSLIENPSHAIEGILRYQLGFTDIDTTAFDNSATALSGWKSSFNILERTSSKEIMEQIAQSAQSYFFINSSNQADIFTFTTTYTTDKDDIKPGEIKSLKTSKTELTEIVSKLDVEYRKDEQSGKFTLRVSRDNSTTETNINNKQFKIIQADKIYDTTTAGYLADHYCKDASTAYWAEAHNIIELETADLRGLNYWQSGNFKPFIALEIFDIIEFDHTEWDSIQKCNGESWSGKQFLIYEITRGKTVKIKALEL